MKTDRHRSTLEIWRLTMSMSGRMAEDISGGGAGIESSLSLDAADSESQSDLANLARAPLWKRVLDICCVLIAIPTLLPVMLFIAVVIKVSSKGPVLFKQERVGLLGKRFILFKFRTMVAGTDTTVHEEHVAGLIGCDGPMIKLDTHGDARLIPYGRVLRAAGLDELPQLINVLRGEMSIVGPRPCLPSEYGRYLPWQRKRFRTLPGLTGLWQVSGKNRTTFNEMIGFDIQYVRTQSLWLDVKIMLKTIPAVIVEVIDIEKRRRRAHLPVRTAYAAKLTSRRAASGVEPSVGSVGPVS